MKKRWNIKIRKRENFRIFKSYFYEIIKSDNDGKYYIDCFTAEYSDSTKNQLQMYEGYDIGNILF